MNRCAALPMVVALSLGLATACSSGEVVAPGDSSAATPDADTPDTPPATDAPRADTTQPDTTQPDTTQPDTTQPDVSTSEAGDPLDASAQLDWILATLAAPEAPSLEEFEAHFAPSFLQLVSPQELIAGLAPVLGDWTIVDDAGDERARSGVIENTAGLRLEFDIAVDPAGLITDLLFRPDGAALPEGPITTESMDEAISSVAPDAGYALFDTTSGTCEPLHEYRADQPQAIGSQFKLWILVALAEQIVAGTIDWNDTVTLTEELRASPDGEVVQQPNGTAMPVRDLARLMISISDNTATDMLLDLVGREQVEDVMTRLEVSTAARNTPFIGTREMFLLKLDPAHVGFLELTPPERRTYLDDTLAGQPFAQIRESDIPDPPWDIDRLEWFATPDDICKTFVRLAELAAGEGMLPLAAALGTNPGTDMDPERWDTVWFKGGSEPGVFAMGWYLIDADGNSFVAAAALNDDTNVFSQIEAAAQVPLMIPLLESLRPAS